MTDGMNTEGDVTDSEAMFSHSEGDDLDGSYGTESEISSESIESDADFESSEPVVDWNACLSEKGWTTENINAWEKEQSELERAMLRRKACSRSCQITGAIDYDSGTCPNVLMMLDGGTFTHMIGNNAMQFTTDHSVPYQDRRRCCVAFECRGSSCQELRVQELPCEPTSGTHAAI